MKSITIKELIAEILKLTSAEQQQILEALQEGYPEIEHQTEQRLSEMEFEQMLLDKGIISEIPSGLDKDEEDFDTIEVTGQPLSETILEERR